MNGGNCANCANNANFAWQNQDRMDEQQARSLRNISIISFVVVELTEYLDTHPCDQDALSYFGYYNRMLNQMTAEYAAKYDPLTIASAEACSKEWKWGLTPLPWERRCD